MCMNVCGECERVCMSVNECEEVVVQSASQSLETEWGLLLGVYPKAGGRLARIAPLFMRVALHSVLATASRTTC